MKQSKETSVKKNWFSLAFSKVKWLITEIVAIYSGKPSYFSKKRIESGIAFVIAQWGMIYFLLEHINKLSMGEFLLWAAAEFAVSGYIINQIQKEKKSESTDTSNEEVSQ
jgi:hypothetical protein